MPTTLTDADLLAALPAELLAAARREGLEPGSTLDPVAEAILTACAVVDFYCAGWLPSAARLTGWACDLAAWQIAKRLTEPTKNQTEARSRTLKELEDLRDGKFPQTPRASVAPALLGKVSHGSRPNIL